jgi:enoyl-CoA hydratase/carnithine racemase
VIDGATAERYGVVNRALPDAELDGFVDALADELAGRDRRVLAEAKALVDHVTLPPDADLVRAMRRSSRRPRGRRRPEVAIRVACGPFNGGRPKRNDIRASRRHRRVRRR